MGSFELSGWPGLYFGLVPEVLVGLAVDLALLVGRELLEGLGAGGGGLGLRLGVAVRLAVAAGARHLLVHADGDQRFGIALVDLLLRDARPGTPVVTLLGDELDRGGAIELERLHHRQDHELVGVDLALDRNADDVGLLVLVLVVLAEDLRRADGPTGGRVVRGGRGLVVGARGGLDLEGIAGPADAARAAVGDPALVALHDVRELVDEQLPPGRLARRERSLGEEDVLAKREGAGVQRRGGPRRDRIGVDPDRAEGDTEARFHLRAEIRRERLTRAPTSERIVNDRMLRVGLLAAGEHHLPQQRRAAPVDGVRERRAFVARRRLSTERAARGERPDGAASRCVERVVDRAAVVAVLAPQERQRAERDVPLDRAKETKHNLAQLRRRDVEPLRQHLGERGRVDAREAGGERRRLVGARRLGWRRRRRGGGPERLEPQPRGLVGAEGADELDLGRPPLPRGETLEVGEQRPPIVPERGDLLLQAPLTDGKLGLRLLLHALERGPRHAVGPRAGAP